ncbi:MAG TPA: aminotransferase class V-fold PLP-dependent enzyme [Dinghuibacter sp.]|jgi:selenocysteine lyase/cysteine desulfurase|uniref:aminotransferase class V-fold PLP-dependent enzyme n=1 Tax=Dinghuibacter sp. TaxID=2024697 RepID=UPI002C099F50|nr:aminotransferase class V-fold PLP-dependent enzyme [Dinghuibacter sp.]HTJ11894.1 aminotransferase class V-fold PLP-dependent enzyme [Dinghuibacter sp.]
MSDRRSFLRQAGLLTCAFSATSLFEHMHAAGFAAAAERVRHLSPADIARDETFWNVIQQSYTVSSEMVNLNNGGVSPSPRVVQEAVERYNKMANQGPSYYMWGVMDKGREPLRKKLAELAGCDPDEIAINRNATEALNTVIFGLDLKKGDEVIGTKQDYHNMVNAWKQRAARDGIRYKQISFDFPIEDDAAIVDAYERAITHRTKVIHVTHIINWVGQIMPVRKIADMAHRHGVQVICDSAHAFGLLDFSVKDLGCDYFGTSLHKFLSAPIGTGMLWIKKENIRRVWTLLSADKPQDGDIRKFESLGTRSFPLEQGVGEAINFHNGIGPKVKEERIRFLKDYWATQVVGLPRVRIHTSLKPEYSCAICGVTVDGLTPGELNSKLFNDYKIHAVGIVWENISCVRITPHVYTTKDDLDRLVRAITETARA